MSNHDSIEQLRATKAQLQKDLAAMKDEYERHPSDETLEEIKYLRREVNKKSSNITNLRAKLRGIYELSSAL